MRVDSQPVKLSLNKPCPCHSGKKAKSCCAPILGGAPAAHPEALMRSRYTAYAIGSIAHIMATTHPSSPHHQLETAQWSAEILAFSSAMDFEGLIIYEAGEQEDRGWVHFSARLSERGEDRSFGERSTFFRVDGRWLYHSGVSD